MYVLTLKTDKYFAAKKYTNHMEAIFSYLAEVKDFISYYGEVPTSIILEFVEQE